MLDRIIFYFSDWNERQLDLVVKHEFNGELKNASIVEFKGVDLDIPNYNLLFFYVADYFEKDGYILRNKVCRLKKPIFENACNYLTQLICDLVSFYYSPINSFISTSYPLVTFEEITPEMNVYFSSNQTIENLPITAIKWTVLEKKYKLELFSKKTVQTFYWVVPKLLSNLEWRSLFMGWWVTHGENMVFLQTDINTFVILDHLEREHTRLSSNKFDFLNNYVISRK